MDLHAIFGVEDRSVVITGGASGIGFAFSDIMSEHGAHVTILDRDEAKLQTALNKLDGRKGQVRGAICDVTDTNSLANAFDEAAAAQNGIDVVFANAGIGAGLPGAVGFQGGRNPEGEINSYDPADWHRVLGVNLTGVFLTAREAVRHLKRQGGGKLIITSSENSVRNTPLIGTSYMVSKAGVAHLMRNLALELAPHGITVNAIAPGSFETDIAGGAMHQQAVKDLLSTMVPLGRIGQVEELKGLALYLASPASSFMTGSEIFIDGGVTAR